MKLADLLSEYERRRAEAEVHGSLAPVAKLYGLVLEELRRVDGQDSLERFMNTEEAGGILGVGPRTAARWCGEGRFPGAVKTSGNTGEWRIPAREVYQTLTKKPEPKPKLWRAP